MKRHGQATGVVYERRGQGDPLVLLHGTGGSRRVWDPVLPLLEREREVVTVDLPGFGESPPLSTAATNAAYADRLELVFRELGLDLPHVAGTSLGGHVALLLGARGAARSVVATSPTGFWTASEARYTRVFLKMLRLNGQLSRPLVPLLARSPVGRKVLLGTGAARAHEMPPEAVAEIVMSMLGGAAFQAVFRAANRERLGGAAATTAAAAAQRTPTATALDAIPVTIAWSQKDRYLPVRQASRARQALPHARHVVLDGCGHLATWDDPLLVAEVLLTGSALPPAPHGAEIAVTG